MRTHSNPSQAKSQQHLTPFDCLISQIVLWIYPRRLARTHANEKLMPEQLGGGGAEGDQKGLSSHGQEDNIKSGGGFIFHRF